jgi:hypothetical protein
MRGTCEGLVVGGDVVRTARMNALFWDSSDYDKKIFVKLQRR